MRNRLRQSIIPLLLIAAFAWGGSPAIAVASETRSPGAHIERTILMKPRQPGNGALLLPTARSIVLAAGTYYWSNVLVSLDDDRAYFNDRTVDLAAGEYWWNCRVWFVDGSSVQYKSNCWLYRVGTGAYAYLPTLWVNVGPNGTNFRWSSELVQA